MVCLFKKKKRRNDARYSLSPQLSKSLCPFRQDLGLELHFNLSLILSLRKYRVQDVKSLAWHDFSQCDLERQKKYHDSMHQTFIPMYWNVPASKYSGCKTKLMSHLINKPVTERQLWLKISQSRNGGNIRLIQANITKAQITSLSLK